MTCYVLAHIDIANPAGYGGYAAAVVDQLPGFGGKVLAAGPVIGLEGPPMTNHNVILEFPDESSARDWYDSEAYQAIIALRHAASASSQVALLPGWKTP